jgi:hypothetical protein
MAAKENRHEPSREIGGVKIAAEWLAIASKEAGMVGPGGVTPPRGPWPS